MAPAPRKRRGYFYPLLRGRAVLARRIGADKRVHGSIWNAPLRDKEKVTLYRP